MLRVGHIRNPLKFLKCGAGEEQRRSVRSHEKRKSIKRSRERKEHPTYNKKKEGKLDWSHLAQALPAKTRYRRKGIRERKKRQETKVATELRQGNEEALKIERESTKSFSGNSFGKGYVPDLTPTVGK